MSMTLLYLSPLVTKPESNCFSIALTSFSEESIIFAFSSGITKSLTPIDDPDLVEKSKPNFKKLSRLSNLKSKQRIWEFCREFVK